MLLKEIYMVFPLTLNLFYRKKKNMNFLHFYSLYVRHQSLCCENNDCVTKNIVKCAPELCPVPLLFKMRENKKRKTEKEEWSLVSIFLLFKTNKNYIHCKMRQTGFIIVACYHIAPLKQKKIFGVVPKYSIAGRL